MSASNRPMKDSGIPWIGLVPTTWEVRRVSSVYSQRRQLVADAMPEDLLSVSEYYGVDYRQRRIGATDVLMRAASLEGYQKCYPDDFVMNIMLAWKGAHASSTYEGVVSPSYAVFRPHTGHVSKYFHYLFRSDQYKDYFKSFSSGIIDSRLRLYPEVFMHLSCHVPPYDEQKRIADFLDEECGKVDSVKQTLADEIETLKRLRKATIHQAVTKGLDPTAPMKPSGIPWIGEMPAEWTLCKQKHAFALVNGRAYANEEFEQEGKYRILRVGNLFSNPVWYSSSMELEPDKYCNDGDLLYSWSMSYGPHIWRGDKVIFHYHIWKVSLSGNVEKLYAYYYLMALTEAIRSEVHETTMSFVTMQSMNNSYIAFPTRTEQQRIVDYLDERCAAIDSVIDTRTKQLERLEDYRKALIFAYVTGKKEINRG